MKELDWDLVSWALRSKNRAKILDLLQIPLTPNIVAKKADLSLTHASKIVRELAAKKLIVCLNENARLGRLYKRTKKGEEINRYLQRISSGQEKEKEA